jgi:aspartate-semialdehyde dehydrogenase
MLRLAVIGATGAVGNECLKLLDGGVVPVGQVVPVASEASAGRDLSAELGLDLRTERCSAIDAVDFGQIDAVVLCAGAELSRREAERIAAAGALVVDNSSAFRQRDDIPLVVPQVNVHLLDERPATGIVANPNCSTIQLVRALQPVHELAGLEQVVVSTYQAASGGGQRGLAELFEGTQQRIDDAAAPIGEPGRFGQPLAFNLVPEIGLPDDTGFSHEELKIARESRRILGLPELRITATAVRVPVVNCHSEAAYVRTTNPVTAAAVEDAVGSTAGLRVYRRDDKPAYPMPRVVGSGTERSSVHVGRIRTEPGDDHAVWLWIVADNLWVGAALNALEIVAASVKAGWLR